MAIAIAKTLLDTRELRAGSVITQTEINALKKRWRPGNHRRTYNIAREECDLEGALPMRVCDEQAHKGLMWLRTKLLRKDGQLRDTKFVQRECVCAEHARIVRSLDHFLFMGFLWDITGGGLEYPQPVYRAVAYNGEFFEYIARPWQAGEASIGPVGGTLV